MSIVGRTYLDPGDQLSGRRTPPDRVTVITGWNGRRPPDGPDWLIWLKPPKQTAPRNVLVEREDGTREVIPFPRRLRRTPDQRRAATLLALANPKMPEVTRVR